MTKTEILAHLYRYFDLFLHCGTDRLSGGTRPVQDLGCSDDVLASVAARLALAYDPMPLNDDDVFLRTLASELKNAWNKESALYIAAKTCPWLPKARIKAIAARALEEAPAVTLSDIAAYLIYFRKFFPEPIVL